MYNNLMDILMVIFMLACIGFLLLVIGSVLAISDNLRLIREYNALCGQYQKTINKPQENIYKDNTKNIQPGIENIKLGLEAYKDKTQSCFNKIDNQSNITPINNNKDMPVPALEVSQPADQKNTVEPGIIPKTGNGSPEDTASDKIQRQVLSDKKPSSKFKKLLYLIEENASGPDA